MAQTTKPLPPEEPVDLKGLSPETLERILRSYAHDLDQITEGLVMLRGLMPGGEVCERVVGASGHTRGGSEALIRAADGVSRWPRTPRH